MDLTGYKFPERPRVLHSMGLQRVGHSTGQLNNKFKIKFRPRGMVRGGRREEGSGWGTRVYLWRIHVDIWQNQYNIVNLKNKIKKINIHELKRSLGKINIWRKIIFFFKSKLKFVLIVNRFIRFFCVWVCKCEFCSKQVLINLEELLSEVTQWLPKPDHTINQWTDLPVVILETFQDFPS